MSEISLLLMKLLVINLKKLGKYISELLAENQAL